MRAPQRQSAGNTTPIDARHTAGRAFRPEERTAIRAATPALGHAFSPQAWGHTYTGGGGETGPADARGTGEALAHAATRLWTRPIQRPREPVCFLRQKAGKGGFFNSVTYGCVCVSFLRADPAGPVVCVPPPTPAPIFCFSMPRGFSAFFFFSRRALSAFFRMFPPPPAPGCFSLSLPLLACPPPPGGPASAPGTPSARVLPRPVHPRMALPPCSGLDRSAARLPLSWLCPRPPTRPVCQSSGRSAALRLAPLPAATGPEGVLPLRDLAARERRAVGFRCLSPAGAWSCCAGIYVAYAPPWACTFCRPSLRRSPLVRLARADGRHSDWVPEEGQCAVFGEA